jgi:CheY-like chemotaxis protein
VVTAPSGHEAVTVLERQPVDLVLSDYRMPGMDGVTFLRRAREVAPDAPRILLTAYPQLSIATRAVEDAGIHEFLTKPLDLGDLVGTIRQLLSAPRPDPMHQHLVDDMFRGRPEAAAAGSPRDD